MDSHAWIDAIRYFEPEENKVFTWWSYRNRSWPGSNRGRRLDHIWATHSLTKKLRRSFVLSEARGWERPSDHVPVGIDIDA